MSSKNDIPLPEEAVAFEPAEFAVAYHLLAQASRELAARRKTGLKVTGGDDGQVAQKARGAILGDALSPLREHYKNDPAKFHSAAYRLTALAKLLRSSHLREWIRVTGEGVAVHGAVLAAAAILPLTRSGDFPIEDFLDEVNRRAGKTPDPFL
jgi:hypothetical protein